MLPIYSKILLLFVCISWIEAIPNYKCDTNEYYNYKDGGDATCQDPDGSSFDVSKNTNGCHCLPGFVRNEHYECVKLEECPEVTNEPSSNPEDSYNIDPNNPETIKLLREIFGTPEDWYAKKNQDKVDDEYPTLRKNIQKVLIEPKNSGYVNQHTDFDLDDPETQKIIQQIFGPNNYNLHENNQDEVDVNSPEFKKNVEKIFDSPPKDYGKVDYRI
ncbi:GSCOCG00000309001-RA-CDS [Cotesia congregata]|nr:GSCOCG00000309001-RA-CDS [Cotesia congregata]